MMKKIRLAGGCRPTLLTNWPPRIFLSRLVVSAGLLLGCTVAAGIAAAQSADVQISQHVVNPEVVAAGATATVTMTVGNAGPDAASNVKLTDTLPAGVTFVSFSASDGGTCTSAEPYECTWASVPKDATRTATLELTFPAAGVYENQAEVTANEPDPNPSNNGLERNITVEQGADLALTASSDATDGHAAGQLFNYKLNVTNHGPDTLPAGNAPTVTFDVPAGASIITRPTGSGWSCEPGGSAYPLTNPPVAAVVRPSPALATTLWLRATLTQRSPYLQLPT